MKYTKEKINVPGRIARNRKTIIKLAEIASGVIGVDKADVLSVRRSYETALARQFVMAWLILVCGRKHGDVAKTVGKYCRGKPFSHANAYYAVSRVDRANPGERDWFDQFDASARAWALNKVKELEGEELSRSAARG